MHKVQMLVSFLIDSNEEQLSIIHKTNINDSKLKKKSMLNDGKIKLQGGIISVSSCVCFRKSKYWSTDVWDKL